MNLLIAVDSAISTEVLVGAVGVRTWPRGTTAHVLSVVVDADVPLEVWGEFIHTWTAREGCSSQLTARRLRWQPPAPSPDDPGPKGASSKS